jgi:hypothetical protein
MQGFALLVNFLFSTLQFLGHHCQLNYLISFGFSVPHRSGRRTIANLPFGAQVFSIVTGFLPRARPPRG